MSVETLTSMIMPLKILESLYMLGRNRNMLKAISEILVLPITIGQQTWDLVR